MASSFLLIALLTVATCIDVRRRRIPNRLTYSGILLGLGLSALATLAGVDREAEESVLAARLGVASWSDSWIGCCACGGIMLAGYVLFPGAIGGGDLKLLALMGAFLGLHGGLEALLWTMVLAGCMAVVKLIWQAGAWELIRRGTRWIWSRVRRQATVEPPLAAWRHDLYLSPAALAATLLVLGNERWHWW